MSIDYARYEPSYEWWDSVFEDAKNIGALMGMEIEDIYFSGFSSQGDGACFEGNLSYQKGCVAAVKAWAPLDIELHKIAEAWTRAQKPLFYKGCGSVEHSGRYNHAMCTRFSLEGVDGRDLSDTAEESLIDVARDFMYWIYRQLKREYEYQRAWNLANAWQELGGEMIESRADARQLVKDMRAAIKSGITAAPSICDALRRQLRDLINQWEKAREKREELDDNFYYYRGEPDARRFTIQEFAAENL